MSAWREQGFVQDSDEEEDFDISVNQFNSKGNSNASYITSKEHVIESGEFLERKASYEVDELQNRSPRFGLGPLQTECNAKNSTFADDATDNAVTISLSDQDSSPLSSPPSSTEILSPTSFSADLLNRHVRCRDETNNHTQQSVQVLIPQQDVNESGSNGDVLAYSTQFTSSRNFRRRKAIQLHPFLIEGEKYRTFMKARGLKPVNIPVAQSHNTTRTPQIETQDGEFQEESYNLNENPLTSPVGSSASLAEDVLQSIEWESYAAEDEDDLPELGAILDQTGLPRSFLSRGADMSNVRKRKKPDHGKLPNIRFRKPRFRILSSSPVSSHTEVGPKSDKQGTTYNRWKDPDSVTSDIGRVSADPELPTPFPSSDRKAPQNADFISLEDNQPSPKKPANGISHLLTPASIRENSKSVSSDSSTDSDDTVRVDIKRVQKKIKGVLPASWLRLDKQAQLSRSSVKNTEPSRNDRYEGQADADIPNETKIKECGIFDEAIDISDDSDSMPQVAAPIKAKNLYTTIRSSKWNLSTGGLFSQEEAREEDLVDSMRPVAARRNNQKETRKRQTKLTNTVTRPNKRVKTGCDIRRKNDRQQGVKLRQIEGKRRRLRAHVQLSIIDMSDQTQEEYGQLPDFIRIAHREAKQLPNKGRHSPTSKSIKLHTAQDTTDARVQLHAWRAGRMKPLPHVPRSDHAVLRRLPLKEIAVNGRQMELRASEQDVNDQEDSPQSKLRTAKVQSEKEVQGQLSPLLQQGKPGSEDLRKKHKATQPSRTRNMFGTSKLIRSAQLEKLDETENSYAHQMDFRHELSKRNIEFEYALKRRPIPAQSAVLASNGHSGTIRDKNTTADIENSSVVEQRRAFTAARRRRRPSKKLSSRRLNVQAKEYRQPEELSPILESPVSTIEHSHIPRTGNFLTGLGGYGTIYTKDFDVSRLEPGTHFHQNTFVGSGALRTAMNITSRSLDQPAEILNHISGNRLSCWGPWNEEVAAETEKIFRSIRFLYDSSIEVSDKAQPYDFIRISLTLRSLIDYISTSLHFLDLIDRRLFIEKMIWLFRETVDMISNHFTSTDALEIGSHSHIHSQNLRPVTLLSVLAGQVVLLADHDIIDRTMKEQVQGILKQIVLLLVRILLQSSVDGVSRFLEENKLYDKREAGIRDEENLIECFTVLRVTLEKLQIPKLSFWDVINNELLNSCNSNDVNGFERAWRSMFTILPLTKMNDIGVLCSKHGLEESSDRWSLVKTLMTRILDLYEETARGQISTLNSYVRACLARCHTLLIYWGWVRCELILGVIFDFFARNKLQNLRLEDPRGSPNFLEHFHTEQISEIEVADRAFHIFLKILAVGLIQLSKIIPEHKIRGTIWRFIPNHGRICRKDETVHKEDIDALRNHHDILTTLYQASPSACRPRIALIKNLVDHRQSHSAACHISICSWIQLAKFQLRTEESAENLDSLCLWYKEITDQTVSQYHSARVEAESLNFGNNEVISKTMLEKTIISNQGQVLKLLTEAIWAMKTVIPHAPDDNKAGKILLESRFMEVFQLHDSQSAQFHTVINEALNVVFEFSKICRISSAKHESRSGEDSQNYGDWPDIDVHCIDNVLEKSPQMSQIQSIHHVLQQLLSNSVGTNRQSDDFLLQRIILSWVEIASCAVLKHEKDWLNYLDAHKQESWHRLRCTEHSRRLYPYFMATVLKYIGNSYRECSYFFIEALLLSLVERESLFKYQHLLLSTLLNIDSNHALLRNSPFCIGSATGKHDIDLATLKERRLQFLSNILSNLRADLYNEPEKDAAIYQRKRQEYRSLLKQSMEKMKSRYLELQEFSSRQGAYVEFVHRMVDLLQQHVTDIQPVDNFFTTSNLFPLPANDPTYIVARLKGYAHKLSQVRSSKQLSVFIQAASERAAIEGRQKQLEDQLHEALSYETEGRNSGMLRRTLLLAIFPTYIEISLANPFCFIIGLPIIHAIRRVFDQLLYQFTISDTASTSSVGTLLVSFLSVTCTALKRTNFFSHCTEKKATISSVLGALFRCISSAVTSLEYIHQCGALPEEALSSLDYLEAFAHFTREHVAGNLDIRFEPLHEPYNDSFSETFLEVRRYSKRELEESLSRHWGYDSSGQYSFSKGSTKKKIIVGIDTTYHESRDSLVAAIAGLHERLTCSKLSVENSLAIVEAKKEEGLRDVLDVMI